MVTPTPAPSPAPDQRAGASGTLERDSTRPVLSLQTYVQIVKRQRLLIAVVAGLTMVVGMVPGLLAEDRYSSTARVQVSALDQEGVFRTDPNPGNPSTDRVIDLFTEVEIIKSRPLRAEVVRELGDDATPFAGPTVTPVGWSRIVAITITSTDPGMAARVANTYAEKFVDDRRSRSTEAMLVKVDELRAQGADASRELESVAAQLRADGLSAPESTNLQLRHNRLAAQIQDFTRRADELEIEASLRGNATHLVEPAVLQLSSITEGPTRGAVLGLTLGVLLGLALAVVADTVQDRIGRRDDLIALRPSTPVLATVPHATVGPRGIERDLAVVEAFRYLATGVRVFGLNAQLRSVLVTSAVGDEGKTTTATNLARALAEAGERVVLIDCDLRRPGVHGEFELSSEKGLSSLVLGDATVDEVTHFVRDNLAVVPAGPPVENPTELLGSDRFATVVRSLIGQADVTILDTPPVLPVADALIAGQLADGALVVTRLRKVRRREVRDLLDRLDEAQLPLLGFVANDSTEDTPYSSYYHPDPTDEPRAARRPFRRRARVRGRTSPPGPGHADEAAAPDRRAGAGAGARR